MIKGDHSASLGRRLLVESVCHNIVELHSHDKEAVTVDRVLVNVGLFGWFVDQNMLFDEFVIGDIEGDFVLSLIQILGLEFLSSLPTQPFDLQHMFELTLHIYFIALWTYVLLGSVDFAVIESWLFFAFFEDLKLVKLSLMIAFC